MANLYVRSTDGLDTDNGSTWALAKATLEGAAAIDAAGDTIYVSQSHAESKSSASIFMPFAGTRAAPSKIICGSDAAEPPTAVASSATITTTGSYSISMRGNFYMHGVSFYAGTGLVNVYINLGDWATSSNEFMHFENCKFSVVGSGSSARIGIGGASIANAQQDNVKWTNCDFSLANSSQSITLAGSFEWNGGSALSGSVSPTKLVTSPGSGRAYNCRISGVDLSNLDTTFSIFGAGEAANCLIRNCKLPASWAGSLVSGTLLASGRYEMHNCDSGSTNYRMWIEDYAGSIKTETTLVKTGGASDGTTPISWKMASSADAEYPTVVLASPEIAIWNETTGSSKTVSLEILHDSLTALTDADIWVEVQYLGNTSFPVGSFASDCKTNVLAAATDQTTSSATWTTTGMTNPNKQKLDVTFTPQKKGYFIARVMLAKASYTIYVDPKLTVA